MGLHPSEQKVGQISLLVIFKKNLYLYRVVARALYFLPSSCMGFFLSYLIFFTGTLKATSTHLSPPSF